MSILKLMRDRQMYKYGQRVNFQRGGTGGGTGDSGSPGTNNDGSNANSGGDGGYRGPSELGVTTRAVNPVAISPVDRSAVSQFSTFGRNTMNQNLQGPSAFSNITGGIKDYVMGGGLLGMGIRGLTNVFGGPKSFEDQYGYGPDYQGKKSYDFGPPDGPGNDDGNQGIMAAYNPYTLPVEEEAPVSQEEEDFIQRYRVANKFRQDKQGQLDPEILEMISKLYT